MIYPKLNKLIKSVIILFIIIVSFILLFLFITGKNIVKVAFLGDSITYFGWTQNSGYVKQFVFKARLSGIKIIPIPAGICGNKSLDMLNRINKDVIAKKPEIVFIMAGMNDINGNFEGKDIFQNNMKKMINIALDNNIKPVILTITVDRENLNSKRNNRVKEYNEFLTSLAKEKGITIIDVNTPLKNEILKRNKPYNVVTTDGVHLNIKGNTIVANEIVKVFVNDIYFK